MQLRRPFRSPQNQFLGVKRSEFGGLEGGDTVENEVIHLQGGIQSFFETFGDVDDEIAGLVCDVRFGEDRLLYEVAVLAVDLVGGSLVVPARKFRISFVEGCFAGGAETEKVAY